MAKDDHPICLRIFIAHFAFIDYTIKTRLKNMEKSKKMEQLGIEPRTSPMLREHYTTKPQPHFLIGRGHF